LLEPKVISNTISLLISKLIPAVLLTLISIIYSRYLSQTEYGTYQTVWSLISVFVILTTFGIPRYILTFGNLFTHQKKETFKIISLTFCVTFIIIAIDLFIYYSDFDFFEKLFIIFLLASQSFYLIQEANIISLLSNHLLVRVNLIYSIIFFAAHLFILFLTGYKLIYFLEAAIFISLLRNLLVWKLSHHLRVTAELEDKIVLNKMQLFWFGLNDSLQILTKWFDKILLLVFLTPAAFAVYFNGTYEIPLIGMALTAFQSIITTQGSREPENDEANIKLFNTSSFFMSGILFPLFALAFIYSNQIMELFFGSAYHESALLFSISALLLPIRICSYTVLLQLKHKGKTILIGSLLDFAIAILCMFLLYPEFHLAGLALAMVIATYFQASFYLFHICRSYSTSLNKLIPLDKLFIRISISVVLILAIKYFVFSDSGYFNFIIGAFAALSLSLYFCREAFGPTLAKKLKLNKE
jgi:O-antigen/teichoic acid export membrane protein